VQRLEISTLCLLHNLNLAAAHFDRIYVLRDGRIITGGTQEEVLTLELVRDVLGVDTHRLIHPATGRLLLAFSPEFGSKFGQDCPGMPHGDTAGAPHLRPHSRAPIKL
jgi:iron complex transport system ATP-binding protein